MARKTTDAATVAPTVIAFDTLDDVAAFVPDGGVWPSALAYAGADYILQTTRRVARGAAFYSTATGQGLYGTADAEQGRADARHTAKSHETTVAYRVLIVGGGPVEDTDGILSGDLSPRACDRPGTPRAMAVCTCGRAIL